MPSLSIVIPVFNEEAGIKQSVEQTQHYMKQHRLKGEIIVVDDGSTDNTAFLLKQCKGIKVLTNSPNKGKGYSVKRGMLAAKSQAVLFMDADLSTSLKEVTPALQALQQHDIVIGSRALPDSKLEQRQPFRREFLGKVFSILVRLLTVKGIKDTQCGFKMFSKKAAKDVFRAQTIDGWGFDVEILFIAQKRGYTILQLPVTWCNSTDSKVSPVSDALRMFSELLKIRWNSMKGAYRRHK